ncbi:hypothetical protein A7M79_00930 [Acinetobacter baumannii]|uniref:hypothetical protein n=1 Tax=Acinetobacter baumannii TaxID=470 RepID=UPI0008DDF297|nr:hypothetical protein [Acinetobacter baumannii]OIH12082.1 hypothetical protein A7M79_00930 [Acinetobacter baumannii]
MEKTATNLKEKLLVNFSIVLSVVIVVYLIFILGSKIKNIFSDSEVNNSVPLEVLSYKMQFLPNNNELKDSFNRDLKNNAIDEVALKKYEVSLQKYLNEVAQANVEIKDSKDMTELELAIANLKAYDEIGYIVIPEKNRKRSREILVENINKLRKQHENIPNK